MYLHPFYEQMMKVLSLGLALQEKNWLEPMLAGIRTHTIWSDVDLVETI